MASYPKFCSTVSKATVRCFSDMAEVGIRFQNQLQRMASEAEDIEHNPLIKERIRKGAAYFLAQMDEWLMPLAEDAPPELDNASVSEQLQDAFVQFSKAAKEKRCLIYASKDSFSVDAYHRFRTEYIIGEYKEPPKKKRIVIPEGIERAELYEQLVAWRAKTAKENSISPYAVLTQKSLLDLCRKPVYSVQQLMMIKGIGAKTVRKYGSELMEIIEGYYEPQASQMRIPE